MAMECGVRGGGWRWRRGLAVLVFAACLASACLHEASALAISAPPPNDNFANAQSLTGGSGTVYGLNAGATSEPREPDIWGGGTIWYSFTAPHDGSVSIDTRGSDFDTVLQAYSGASLRSLVRLAQNDDYYGVQSRVQMDVSGGQTYMIRVQGYTASSRGNVALHWATGARLGDIAGHVTDALTRDPISGVDVTVYAPDGSGGWNYVLRNVSTDATGAYDIAGLAAGVYRVRFYDPSGAHAFQYYSDRSTLTSANDVVVGSQTVSGVDAAMAPASHISGHVTDAVTHAPIGGVDVTVYAPDGSGGWTYVYDVSTDATGAYDFGGLAAGTCRVRFHDSSGAHVRQYYHDKSTLTSADDVSVGASQTVSGIDAAMAPASHVTGHVTDAVTHAPIGGVDVTVYAPDGSGGWTWANDVSTDASGAYDVGGLAAGTYRVGFWDSSGAHPPQYFDEQSTLTSADDVAVGASQTVLGIDAAMAPASHITGHVTDALSRVPIGGVDVTVYASDGSGGWTYVSDASTDAKGAYRIGGLPAGTYRVGFWDSSGAHLPQYYSEASSLTSADDVGVGGGQTIPGVDAAMVSSIFVDTTPPDTAISTLPVGWVKHDVTFSLSASDTDSPLGISTLYGLNAPALTLYTGQVLVSTEGTTTISYRSVDASGNWEPARAATVLIDKTPPRTVCDYSSSYTGTATVTLVASDTGGSGVAATYYQLDAGPTQVGTTITLSPPSSGASPHTISFWSQDAAGNIETATPVSFSIKATTIPPVATRLSHLRVSPSSSRHGNKLTFTAYLSPGVAALSGISRLLLYHSETKTVTRKIKGKNRRVRVTYWRLRRTMTMQGSATGRLAASGKLPYAGRWEMKVKYSGSSRYSGSAWGVRTFVVK